MDAWQDDLGAPCEGLFHQGRLCMFEVDELPAGPFTTGQWAVFGPSRAVCLCLPLCVCVCVCVCLCVWMN